MKARAEQVEARLAEAEELKIEGIIIPAERGLFSWFHKGEEDRMIRWENVRTVGDDVILVETEPLLL